MTEAASPDPAPRDTDQKLTALKSLEIQKDPGRLAPRRRVPRWAVILVVLVVLIGGYAALQAATRVPVVQTARVLRVSPVADQEITTANGYVRARTRASVASKVQGRLLSVLVDEGDVVSNGQLLAEVDHSEQDAALDEVEAQLDSSRALVPARAAELQEAQAAQAAADAVLAERRAGVAEAEAVLQERESSYGRTEQLFEKGIAGAEELDRAREQRDVARARRTLAETALATAETLARRAVAAVEVARQRVRMAEHDIQAAAAAVQMAKATRDNAFIRAPFAGMVLRREAEPGEVVSPANTGASGSKTAVVTLADFATLEVEVDVYERDIARVETRTPCRVVLDAYPKRRLKGAVRLLRPTADRTRATIQVYVSFETVPDIARPEMGARVVFFEPGTDVLAPDHLMIPQSAVTERDGVQGVFVLTGKAVRFRAVELGESADESARRIAREGLQADERVVLDPEEELADGLAVVAEGD